MQSVASNLAQSSAGLGGYLADIALPLPLFASGIIQIAGGVLFPRLLSKFVGKDGKKPWASAIDASGDRS